MELFPPQFKEEVLKSDLAYLGNDGIDAVINLYTDYSDFFLAKCDDYYGGSKIIQDDYEKFPHFYDENYDAIFNWLSNGCDIDFINGDGERIDQFVALVTAFFVFTRNNPYPNTAPEDDSFVDFDDCEQVIKHNDQTNRYYDEITEQIVGLLVSDFVKLYVDKGFYEY